MSLYDKPALTTSVGVATDRWHGAHGDLLWVVHGGRGPLSHGGLGHRDVGKSHSVELVDPCKEQSTSQSVSQSFSSEHITLWQQSHTNKPGCTVTKSVYTIRQVAHLGGPACGSGSDLARWEEARDRLEVMKDSRRHNQRTTRTLFNSRCC